MKNIIKSRYLIRRVTGLFIMALLIGACSETFLELPPKNSGTVDQFYTNEADFETAIAGVYNGFSGTIIGIKNMEEYRSDNLFHTAYIYQELSENQFGLSTTAPWWNLYTTIVFPTNTILERIDDVEMDTDVKNRIKGEAYFLRGFAYYTMNLWFGGVPMVTSTLTIEESYTLGRSTEDEIWDFVESDLLQAVALLNPSTEIGRADKYDAETFLAKAYTQRQKWSDAKTALKDVWENSGASLETNFTDMWTMDAEKTSNEYMLSVILSDAEPNNNWAQQFLYIEKVAGQGNFSYKPGYYESFEAGDIRRDETLGFSPTELEPENRKYDFGYDVVNKRFVGDIIVLRFADVQLLYAEAISMAAGSAQQQSLDLINETRNRAGLTSLTLADVPSLDAFVEASLAERRSELAWEGHRYTDLKRHGKLVEKVNNVGPEYDFDATYNYIPLPQSEIDKVGEDILVQNPGY
jgi:hypothetical protein